MNDRNPTPISIARHSRRRLLEDAGDWLQSHIGATRSNACACRLLLIVAALLAISPVTALAEPPKLSRALNSRLDEFELRVLGGRIVPLRTTQPRRTVLHAGHQQLIVRTVGPSLTISLESRNQTHLLTYHVVGSEVRLLHDEYDRDETIEFHQPATGDLEVTYTSPKGRRTISAPTLWRLMVAHPDIAARLAPLLELLKPNWRLLDTVKQIEEALIQTIENPTDDDVDRWWRLVKQLDSNTYAERQTAELELRRAGMRAVGYLTTLNSANLSVEQRFRIESIVNAIGGGVIDDNGEQVAMTLASDPEFLLSLLEREDATMREVALTRLEAMLMRRIEFDFEADEAGRRQQIDTLRSEVMATQGQH